MLSWQICDRQVLLHKRKLRSGTDTLALRSSVVLLSLAVGLATFHASLSEQQALRRQLRRVRRQALWRQTWCLRFLRGHSRTGPTPSWQLCNRRVVLHKRKLRFGTDMSALRSSVVVPTLAVALVTLRALLPDKQALRR